jgi:hypothetical protein
MRSPRKAFLTSFPALSEVFITAKSGHDMELYTQYGKL